MIESKLWHSKTELKNVKVAKTVELSRLVTNTLIILILVIFSAPQMSPLPTGRKIDF